MVALPGRRTSYRTVYLYIAREYLFSFVVAFLFFFSIFFINQLLLLAEDILSKNVAFTDVALLVVYSLPAIVTFTFPFSSLVGALMAAGRLSADNEILAFRAAGISYRRLLIPFVVTGLAFSLISFVAGDYFLPRGTIAFGRLYREILYSNPALELEPHSVHNYKDATIVTGDVSEDGIDDIIIIDTTREGEERVLIAEKATLAESRKQQGVVSLSLESVYGHTVPAKKKDDFDYFSSSRMEYNILLKSMTFSLSSLSPREMSSLDVYREIVKKQADLHERKENRRRKLARKNYSLLLEYYSKGLPYARELLSRRQERESSVEERFLPLVHRLEPMFEQLSSIHEFTRRPIYDRSLRIHLIEFHKKIAIPFGCLAFVFFAFPLGGIARKTGRSVGFGLGLLVSVVYWALLFAGQTLGLRFLFDPTLAMWIPNIVIVTAGIILFRLRSRV